MAQPILLFVLVRPKPLSSLISNLFLGIKFISTTNYRLCNYGSRLCSSSHALFHAFKSSSKNVSSSREFLSCCARLSPVKSISQENRILRPLVSPSHAGRQDEISRSISLALFILQVSSSASSSSSKFHLYNIHEHLILNSCSTGKRSGPKHACMRLQARWAWSTSSKGCRSSRWKFLKESSMDVKLGKVK